MSIKTNLLILLLVHSLTANAQRYSILIHEIMADPQPVVSLPDAEYVELRNSSAAPINLAGWRLQTSSATSGAFPAYTLQPDSFAVITTRNNTQLFGPNTLGVPSFPALPNSGTTLVLLDAAGQVVHAVAYQAGWYQNAVKAEGGWSLEMIDAANPCSGSGNWKAAVAPTGGTPGSANSVRAVNKDDSPPGLWAATTPDSLHLLLHFDESLDSTSASITARYRIAPNIEIVTATPLRPLFNQVLLQLQSPLQQQTNYTVSATALTDCVGNGLGSRNQTPAGLPQLAQPGDVVINEILFNPKPGGTDYVELYNRSKKLINAGSLWIANQNTSGALSTPQKISVSPAYLFPGAYAVLTENREDIQHNYLVKNSAALWMQALPSLPDEKGSFVLLNEAGTIIDTLSYHNNWHFALLANPSGVALERIDPNGPTQDKTNWTSAAASAGFGTPTYQNSQYHQPVTGGASIEVNPKVFSPDNDGYDDICTISFQLGAPGFVANLHIFDISGRPIRHLVQNQTLAQSGTWRWDGLNDKGQALPVGTYILLLELLNLQGKKQQYKKTVVLGRK